jgi:hypothetical protein
MIARCIVALAALLAGSGPALAEIRVDQSEVSGGALVVTGQVSPPRAVTLGVGISAIQLKTDPDGRFVWIGDQVPPSCTVTVSNGYERARAAVGGCGGILAFAPSAPVDYGASGSYSSWRTDGPAPGIGTVSQTTTTTTVASVPPPGATSARSETTYTTTTRTTRRPLIISPNDPRYAQTEPTHWGIGEVQGDKSGEVLYTPPPRGFYANVRSREGN